MRRLLLAISVLAAIAVAPASADAGGYVGAPLTHGPDPVAVARGPETPALPAVAKRSSKRVPSSWCGAITPADDRVHEVDNGPFRYHAVYMVAADAPNRFAGLAASLQTDAFQASALLESSYGRAIRFDIGISCGPQYLDISVVRLPQSRAQM